jgi:hypothetical protein
MTKTENESLLMKEWLNWYSQEWKWIKANREKVRNENEKSWRLKMKVNWRLKIKMNKKWIRKWKLIKEKKK